MTDDTSNGYAIFILAVPEIIATELQSYLTTRLLIAWFRYRRHNLKSVSKIFYERDLIYYTVLTI